MLRIRIKKSLTQTTFTGAGTLSVGPGTRDLGKARVYTFQSPLRITHDKQGFVITEPSGQSVRWRLGTIKVTSSARRVTIDDHPYPGRVELVAVRDKAGRTTGRFDAVNHVGMESYLPGVLSQELYPGWDPEAYRAQAVAARSYAIWERQIPVRRKSHFELESNEASQAYVGDKASPKARAAVAATAGQVLVYDGRVLPAFYSSCSGGTGQDAVAAWPGKVDDLAPLRGRDHGNWGSISNRHRWGPVALGKAPLAKGFAQWGRANKHPIAGLQGLRSIQPSATNTVGRPTRFAITDGSGRRFELPAEAVRNATNLALPEHALTVEARVYSSHAAYTFQGNTVTITGNGFGHGVGMCQFGAQHMASRGNDHKRILGFYYPGAKLQRAY